MKKYAAIGVVVIALVAAGVFLYQREQIPDGSAKSGDEVPLPSIDASEGYGKDFKTYESELGFSFKYPPYLQVLRDPQNSGRIVLTPVEKQEGGMSAIVISVGDNDEHMTPEEWLLGPTSGFSHSEKYFKSTIDGQPAVYTDGGMWTVVNTPDDKKRLSIADLTEGDAGFLFSEMGIVIESLSFN